LVGMVGIRITWRCSYDRSKASAIQGIWVKVEFL
jgi:hypothetical protein